MTSFSASRIAGRLTGSKKAGHIGTLDPMAGGVLPVALGAATRFIDFIPEHEKEYLTVMRFGESYDTLDITGNLLESTDFIPSPGDVKTVTAGFLGKSLQTPPMYSAIKKNGVPLYRLARQGIETTRSPREINISKIEVLSMDGRDATLLVRCSKGTYIRSLISDIGEKLSCPAAMAALTRTESNGFTLDDSHTLDELRQSDDASPFVIPTDAPFCAFDAITVTDAQAKRFSNGGALDINRLGSTIVAGKYRIYSPGGSFLGLGKYESGEKELKILRLYTGTD